MSKPCIICVAITGSVPKKKDNPNVPISISEQIESTHEAFEAGATICHAHVRNEDETPTSDPEKFSLLKDGISKHCPGMIIQFSTGGRSGSGKERGGMLPLKPDMASLSVGSNNFPTRVYENSPELILWLAEQMRIHKIMPEVEAFDLSHIINAIDMHSKGLLFGDLYVQFVMGIKNAMPADKTIFNFYVELMQKRAPKSEWCGAGIGANQILVNEWSIQAGGHTRVGMEDNVRLDKNTLAPSNAALVNRAVELCEKYNRPVATSQEARSLLGLSG
ncbi:MAG: 3-keto-5-aminohexanoate cleavage protein [Rhodobacterales bacterium]|jgi:3-keto-5-aminohexanoate cleavage enzyme|nr:3-keto-5-aminohexanoate cleavage protein [Rhodobacterales bacterium]MDC3003502.1 3-keto-5-aminohexanoate cleavage protein [Paracoccaceae bacterium]|tara:strand:+ start:328 stop:1155 length:828 start_codon:yes stop_codon:yes gene_type:complete